MTLNNYHSRKTLSDGTFVFHSMDILLLKWEL